MRRNRLDRLIGVGETHSPPGESRRALAAAVAQAGIYALGQIIRSNSNRLVVLVPSKCKSVALLLMSMKEYSLNMLARLTATSSTAQTVHPVETEQWRRERTDCPHHTRLSI